LRNLGTFHALYSLPLRPSACIALPLNRWIDLPVFLLANVAIDIEPLLVMTLNLSYPLHGYAHTLLGATLIGLGWGGIAYAFEDRSRTS